MKNDTLDKLEFCAKTANTPLAFEDWYPLGYHSVALEGFWRPEDGDLLSLLHLAFARYFNRITARINLAIDDDGYCRFTARLSEKANQS